MTLTQHLQSQVSHSFVPLGSTEPPTATDTGSDTVTDRERETGTVYHPTQTQLTAPVSTLFELESPEIKSYYDESRVLLFIPIFIITSKFGNLATTKIVEAAAHTPPKQYIILRMWSAYCK